MFDNLLASVDFKLENLENRLPDELKQKAQRRLAALNSLKNAAEIKTSLIALAHGLQAQLPTKEATQSAVQILGETAETPVKANLNSNPKILAQHVNTHAHFPNEFEHNEQLGWIPKGWEPSNLKEFGKVITGKTPPKKIDDAFDLEGIPFITPSDVEGDVFTLNVIRHLTESGVASVKNNIVEAESVCVTCIGSQMGKTTITPVKSVTNQQLNSIVLGEKYLRDYIFLNLRMRREELFNLGSSGSTMPILNKTSFENLSVLKPNESSLKAFDDITESYLAKILLNSQNNTKLTTMRDTLLPKLISGELQIPDVATDEEIVD
ncbi:restriction endonuclease subunit S [Pseudoalteromonas sp. ESRF-bin5]|uniref:restriction endonuclease subunit S n=1 Tax=Pseudoalteromonas sp. ESRF-bin5 TaxID=2014532 RepID=UPI002580DEC3|nr:restriction endonuclease subunit S [Pseudoalteromonas sp. ESRF-bin5]